MRIIHCADIHLDSPMNRLDSTEKRKERKAELIKAFTDMVSFASDEDVSAIIIAGDLFDQSRVSATARNAVMGTIEKYPEIEFYYLKGNHDKADFPGETEQVPDNFHMFSDRWVKYDLGENTVLYGVEMTGENSIRIYSELNPDVTCFNIVTMHGQDSLSTGKDDAQTISVRDLKNKNIDYLALGHVHSYKEERLDSRGLYCYPGCLEARGYDETGKHGFVLLDINGPSRTCSYRLISHAIRTPHNLKVDITGLSRSTDMLNRIEDELDNADYPSKDLVEVELTGEIGFESEKNLSFIGKQLEDRYFDFKIKDSTEYKVDYESYRLDESLKGEFIRTVEAEKDISEEDKAEIIRMGIKALKGEEIE